MGTDRVVLGVVVFAACAQPSETRSESVPIDQVGVDLVLGNVEHGEPLALFSGIIDAAASGDRIAVLDQAPPFLRLFDRTGSYVGSAVLAGDGPGELRRPLGIERAEPDGFLVTEATRGHWLDRDGQWIRSESSDGRYFRGVAETCGSRIVRVVTAFRGFEQPGAITVSDPAVQAEDTVATLGPLRPASLRTHPLLIDSDGSGLVVYADEVDQPRLLIMACDGQRVREIGLDSLGLRERFVPADDGSHGLYPPEPPIPSGIARVGRDVLWLTQELSHRAEIPDTVTAVTLITEGGRRHRLTLEGWYQLLARSDDGRLLFARADPVAQLLVVEAEALVGYTRRHGSEREAADDGVRSNDD